METPRYSASLSKSPCPSFFEESDKIIFGFVKSYAWNASSAYFYAYSSPTNKNKASFFWLKILSTASLSKGITAA